MNFARYGWLRNAFASVAEQIVTDAPRSRSERRLHESYGTSADELLQWLERPELRVLAQPETRGHMASDLAGYLFASVFRAENGTVRRPQTSRSR